MKIIANGDVHGTEGWRMSVSEPRDHLVFIGDYFDAYTTDITAEEEIEIFKAILSLKKSEPDKVTLLIGNHDYHYLQGVDQHYSRYQPRAAKAIRALLGEALEYMQMCFVYKDIVFNHAGITKTWSHNYNIDLNNLENSINTKFKTNPAAFGFVRGIGDNNGSDRRQSPIWVRPQQLLEDKIDGYKQVVGHTRQPFHRILNGVAFIDVPGSFFTIEDADAIVWK